MITAADKEEEVINNLTPVLQYLYQTVRDEGFSSSETKEIFKLALSYAMLNETFSTQEENN